MMEHLGYYTVDSNVEGNQGYTVMQKAYNDAWEFVKLEFGIIKSVIKKGQINMLSTYLYIGISTFLYLIPIAIIVFCVFTGIKFLIKGKCEFKLLRMLCEFTWILTVLAILNITGITSGNFGTTSIFDEYVHFSFNIFEEGFSMATLLNIILFIPFGFFSAIVFKKFREKWINGVLISIIFSVIIELLQTFTGRFAQLDDVLMNTTGAFIGYEIWFWLSKLKQSIEYKYRLGKS